jgi:hypothetical protein
MEGGTMQIVYTVLAVVAFTALLTFISMKKRKSSWAGTVTNIRQQTVQQGNSEDGEFTEEQMVISYKTDQGKKGHLQVNMATWQKFYADLSVGDRFVKKSGEYMPMKEQS